MVGLIQEPCIVRVEGSVPDSCWEKMVLERFN